MRLRVQAASKVRNRRGGPYGPNAAGAVPSPAPKLTVEERYKMEPNIVWEKRTLQYSASYHAICGKWSVGSYHHNISRRKDEVGKNWTVTSSLPGIEARLGTADTHEEAKAMIEKAARQWFANVSVC